MKIIATAGTPDKAVVYIADMGEGRLVEFVEALQPPYPRDERWILMVSTLYGCPVKCLICDAGGQYRGKPSAQEIIMQVDYLVKQWYPNGRIPAEKFKIQFARMGEPALNRAVLEVLEVIPSRYHAPGLIPSVSTVAPKGADDFLMQLKEIKNRLYPNGRFQLQFSIHTTDSSLRDKLIPIRKWDFTQIAAFGNKYHQPGDRKITLNFALAAGMPVEPDVLLQYFDPAQYLIKLTPVNPTCRAVMNGLVSYIDPLRPESASPIAQTLSEAGYDVIVSIGEVEENQIGSNCGQYVLTYMRSKQAVKDGYTYRVKEA